MCMIVNYFMVILWLSLCFIQLIFCPTIELGPTLILQLPAVFSLKASANPFVKLAKCCRAAACRRLTRSLNCCP